MAGIQSRLKTLDSALEKHDIAAITAFVDTLPDVQRAQLRAVVCAEQDQPYRDIHDFSDTELLTQLVEGLTDADLQLVIALRSRDLRRLLGDES